MMELDDCGKEFLLTFDGFPIHGKRRTDVNVIMVIRAPRGNMALFDYKPHGQWKAPTEKHTDRQCQAIKLFMEEHSHDQA